MNTNINLYLVVCILYLTSCNPPPEKTMTLSGTIEISVQFEDKVSGFDTLFVIAEREPGHPLVMKKYTHLSFPMGYSLSAEDMINPGKKFFGEYKVYARIERDQGIGTQNDLVGEFKGGTVAVGRTDIHILIDQEM